MKRVAYKFKHIRWKFDVKQNITEHFKFKQQKSFVSLLILQNFFNPFPDPILFQPWHLYLIAVNWNY